jgi:hypothetical protein
VWIYPEAQQLRDTLIYVPEWTGGLAIAEHNSTMLALKPGQTSWMKSVVPHELTHLLMNARIFNCRGGDLPTWLNEGVAMYSERDPDTNARTQLVRLLNDGQISGLSALQDGFQADGTLARASYTYGGEVTRFMLTTLGREKFALLLGFGKRRGELLELGDKAGTRAILREYNLPLLDALIITVTSGLLVSYSFYTFSAPNLPTNHTMMLTIPVVLYGLFRYFQLIYVKGKGDAPDELALKDRPLQAAVIVFLAVAGMALYVLR